MNKFTLIIELGNDAMQDGRNVADALRKLAGRIEDNDFRRVDGGGIMDLNGNSVGKWEVS
jgi:hypothetical protein